MLDIIHISVFKDNPSKYISYHFSGDNAFKINNMLFGIIITIL